MTNFLTIKNISKKFTVDSQTISALEDISFDIQEGEFTIVIGPSGCGKSTLLRIIARLANASSGELVWKNSSKPPTVSFVFQDFALFPFLTVWDNITFGLKMKNTPQKNVNEIAQKLIEEVGLQGFESKHPKELSGGMKQRVGIARALSIEPELLLLDEPFSSLDEFTASSLRKLLLEICTKRNITVLMVTHLISEAIELSDQIIVLTPSPGRIEKILPNNLEKPRNKRSQKFFELEDKLQELIKF